MQGWRIFPAAEWCLCCVRRVSAQAWTGSGTPCRRRLQSWSGWPRCWSPESNWGACSCPDRVTLAGNCWSWDMHEEERVLHARWCPTLIQLKLRCSRKTSQCSLQQDPAELRCSHNPAVHSVAPVTFERGTINSLTRYYDPTQPIHSKGTVAPQRLAFRTLWPSVCCVVFFFRGPPRAPGNE